MHAIEKQKSHIQYKYIYMFMCILPTSIDTQMILEQSACADLNLPLHTIHFDRIFHSSILATITFSITNYH